MMDHNNILIISIAVSFSALLFTPTMSISNAQSNITSSRSDPASEEEIAEGIYKNRLLSLGTNVKNIVLLIPNEGHESPDLPEELRLINQPYVPTNLIVGPNTQISWINGDVGHQHTVTVKDENSQEIYSTEEFEFNSMSDTVILNDTGIYTYSESNVNKDDPKFVMEGTITVKNYTSTINDLPETVGFLMVPSKDLDEHVSELTGTGIEVIDNYTFKDLRGGQKGTGPQQALLFLGTSNGQDELASALKNILPTLPYS